MTEITGLTQVISACGVAGLAVLVYLELRAIRPILAALNVAVTALLERERFRSGPIRMPTLPTTDGDQP